METEMHVVCEEQKTLFPFLDYHKTEIMLHIRITYSHLFLYLLPDKGSSGAGPADRQTTMLEGPEKAALAASCQLVLSLSPAFVSVPL